MHHFWCQFCVVFALTLAGIDCFQWTADLPNNTVEYACEHDDLRLPWDYTTSAGANIISIQWFFEGHSQEVIAIYSHGNFAPTAAFSDRVQFLSNAGLVLKDVVVGDSGNYFVEITGLDASGTFFAERRDVMVQITKNDQLVTTDGYLHATLEPKAIYSNATGEWSLVLSCGNFTYLGDPPFDMEWLTDSGVVSPSGRYDDGWFQLEVLTGGNYTCRIPQQAVADACLVHSSAQASIDVDKMEARMMLMEAQLKNLQKDNDNLRGLLSSATERVNPRVGFTAKVSITHSGGGRIVYRTVLSSFSTGYDRSTGYFTAPVAGMYFFTATSSSYTSHSNPDSYVKKDGSTICSIWTPDGDQGDVGSCSGVVHMNVGERAYVTSDFVLSSQSFFSGFLISSDQ